MSDHHLSVQPTTPEAQAWVDSLNADIADGSLWKTPSIRLQLREHRERLGLDERS